MYSDSGTKCSFFTSSPSDRDIRFPLEGGFISSVKFRGDKELQIKSTTRYIHQLYIYVHVRVEMCGSLLFIYNELATQI